MPDNAERQRLVEYKNRESNWKQWGPYLSDRAWGTVREDYSASGSAWAYFPHDHARSRAYRWNEDGLAGICDRSQYLCFALAFWNGQDPILKERFFGLNGHEGNHGEDVKEVYFHLDNTPSHSYMKMLYKYPQASYPYETLVRENGRRDLQQPEFNLEDTGIFDDDRYFDIFVEYAKAHQKDILVQVTAHNRGPEAAPLWFLPTLWFRNTWSWGYENGPMKDVPGKPDLHLKNERCLQANHPVAGTYYLYSQGHETWLFTENETNRRRLYGAENDTPFVKDAFHRYLIQDEVGAVNPEQRGTKAAALFQAEIGGGESITFQLRLCTESLEEPLTGFKEIFKKRGSEANSFYDEIQHKGLSNEQRSVQRQAYAGLLWNKQLYYFDVRQWLRGDPASPPPPEERWHGRNSQWEHLNNFDILSMPDKWEYPWFAAWDLAFHCIPLAMLDPAFAKRQLVLLTREWYIHANGQLPAYEWAFGDVNPPVQAWATWRVYRMDARLSGKPDRAFLEGMFNKLLLNFTWWVNRKDVDGRNIFQGGFLGLDNISLFDRSTQLPGDSRIDQSDGTAWMGFYCLNMLKISLELAKKEPVYQDMATKFYEHFLSIAAAISGEVRQGDGLWDDADHFFYDELHMPNGDIQPLKVRSLVGLMPLIATETLPPAMLEDMDDFNRRVEWFLLHRPNLSDKMTSIDRHGKGEYRQISIVTRERLDGVLSYMLDENEFLSPYGIRSLSKVHTTPYSLQFDGDTFSISYQPGESQTSLFGGNSNWRGPIWFPINYLLIESLREYHKFYGDAYRVECPTGSGNMLTLEEVADELCRRLCSIFLPQESGERPVYGKRQKYQQDLHWRDYLLFYEYFHGDTGVGLGASHQTGWTALVAMLI